MEEDLVLEITTNQVPMALLMRRTPLALRLWARYEKVQLKPLPTIFEEAEPFALLVRRTPLALRLWARYEKVQLKPLSTILEEAEPLEEIQEEESAHLANIQDEPALPVDPVEGRDAEPELQPIDDVSADPQPRARKGGRFSRFVGRVRAFFGRLCCCKARRSRATAAAAGVAEMPATSTAMPATSNAAHDREIRPFTVKSFTFHQCLGEGTYGKVVLATHRDTQRRMAVKMVKKSSLQYSSFSSPLGERRVLEMVGDWQFFTHGFGAFQTKDYMFYAMENVTGGSLSQLMERGPLDSAVTRFISAEILCGLTVLHALGIVHRDLKPDNILLDSAGHVKMADFSLSATEVFGSTTLSGDVGTPKYLAPEIVLQRPYNSMVDYFAFGIIVYEMATGSYPYFFHNIEELLIAIVMNPPYFPPEMDPDTRDYIELLLCRDPEERQSNIKNLPQHPFFKDIDWSAMEDGTACPPSSMQIIPSETEPSCNIKPDVLMSACKGPKRLKRMEKIAGFTFISDRWREM